VEKMVFSVVEWNTEDEICCVGTAIAISPQHVLTSWDCAYEYVRAHHDRRNMRYSQFVASRRFVSLMFTKTDADVYEFHDKDIIEVDFVSANKAENWCIFRRKSGAFAAVSELCPETELPKANDGIAVYDAHAGFEYGEIMSNDARVEWYHCIGADCKVRKRVLPEDCEGESEHVEEEADIELEGKSDDVDAHHVKKKDTSLHVDEPVTKIPDLHETAPALTETLALPVVKAAVRVKYLPSDIGHTSGCPFVNLRGKVVAMRADKAVHVLCRLPKLMEWFAKSVPFDASAIEDEGENSGENSAFKDL